MSSEARRAPPAKPASSVVALKTGLGALKWGSLGIVTAVLIMLALLVVEEARVSSARAGSWVRTKTIQRWKNISKIIKDLRMASGVLYKTDPLPPSYVQLVEMVDAYYTNNSRSAAERKAIETQCFVHFDFIQRTYAAGADNTAEELENLNELLDDFDP